MMEKEKTGGDMNLLNRVAEWLGGSGQEDEVLEEWPLGAEGWIDTAPQGGDILQQARIIL
ncbi:hypothetical protein GCM10007276_13070 [Agaricicola taiwanensis]|uniref:Uncharacterized protein n=1 Tax=Agaricicola taiwanensis TaxID=591372 RepID=A0A8J2YGP8_9RHOB|nr:hypothetical protein [Agaricicola taiwanensis]GGE36993.1 hypothetical protein GCM10007276_13070 [Agaricicola taiwanensis]